MARQDIERQNELEPKRMEFAVTELRKLGIEPEYIGTTQIKFLFKGARITFFPYSGWHSGKTIIDGRGIEKLLNQVKPTT